MNPGFGLINVTNQEYSHVGAILARNKKGYDNEYETRAFVPSDGVLNNPVCGSSTLTLFRYLEEIYNFDSIFKLRITQGVRLNRYYRIDVLIEKDEGKVKYNSGSKARSLVGGNIHI